MLLAPGLDNALLLLGMGGEDLERLPDLLAVQFASALARDRGDIDAFSAREEQVGDADIEAAVAQRAAEPLAHPPCRLHRHTRDRMLA